MARVTFEADGLEIGRVPENRGHFHDRALLVEAIVSAIKAFDAAMTREGGDNYYRIADHVVARLANKPN